jgi:hypothetical protein
MNTTFQDLEPYPNGTLLWKLHINHPDFIPNVPGHWLAQDAPTRFLEYVLLSVYLILCVPANICQFLVILVFLR